MSKSLKSSAISKKQFPALSLPVFIIITLVSIYLTFVSGKTISILYGLKIPLRHGMVVIIPLLIVFSAAVCMKKGGIKTAMKMFYVFCTAEGLILIYFLYQFFDHTVISHGKNIIYTLKHSLSGVIWIIKFNVFYFMCIAPVLIIGVLVLYVGLNNIFGSGINERRNKKRIDRE